MRIPSSSFPDSLINQLQQLTSQQAQLQNQVSTGQRITKPSDDPLAVGSVLKMESEKQQLMQFSKNNDTATAISQSVYTNVTTLKSISDRAGELSALGTGVTSPDTYQANSAELNQLIEQGLQTVNANYNGVHLFGGTKTDTPPFTATRNASGNITAVTYNGSADAASVQVSENATVSPYTNGTTNQQFADFLNHLVSLRDAMKNQDAGAVQAAQPGLQTSEDNIIQTVGGIGAVQTGLEAYASQNQARFADLENNTSHASSADIAQTVVKLTQMQTAYQAALQSGAKIMNLSLLNYLPAT